jgi:hypothetical protein
MSFERTLAQRFPGAVPMQQFVASSQQALAQQGFRPDNTLACIGLCRDEICVPFADALQAVWGPCFSFASLAGAVLPGHTAFGAFLHHAPLEGGRHRIALFGFTHIAVDAAGEPGPCERPGMPAPSNACGALVGFHGELDAGLGALEIDPDDPEYGLLRQRMAARLEPGTALDLVGVTMLAHRVLAEDLERQVRGAIDPAHVDAAIFTGVQVHGPAGAEWVNPGQAYTLLEQGRVDLA